MVERINKIVLMTVESYKVEVVKEKGEDDKVIFTGTALPFKKQSRNGCTYNQKKAIEVMDTLKNKPFLFNHDMNLVYGHTTENISQNGKGIQFEADIDPEEKDFIRKAKRGDIANVSIGTMVEKVVEEEGELPEVYISEFVELSAVSVPGFIDANLNSESYVSLESLVKKGKTDEKDKLINIPTSNNTMVDEKDKNDKEKEEQEALMEGLKEAVTKLTERIDTFEDRIVNLETALKQTNDEQEKLKLDNQRVEKSIVENQGIDTKTEYNEEGLKKAMGVK